MSGIDLADRLAQSCEILDSKQCRVGAQTLPFAEMDHPELQHAARIESLSRYIYDVFHARQAATAHGAQKLMPLQRQSERNYAALLDLANAGRGWWASGWRSDGGHSYSNGRISLLAAEHDVKATNGEVSIRFPAAQPYVSVGFYVAISNAGPPSADAALIRLYLNSDANCTPKLLRQITEVLADLRCPGVVKTLNNPAHFGRADSCVTYLALAMWPTIGPELIRIAREFPLDEKTSLFARRIAAGIAYAEEPVRSSRTNRSFGEICAQLVAKAVVDCWENGDPSVTVAHAIRSNFERANLDPQRPWMLHREAVSAEPALVGP